MKEFNHDAMFPEQLAKREENILALILVKNIVKKQLKERNNMENKNKEELLTILGKYKTQGGSHASNLLGKMRKGEEKKGLLLTDIAKKYIEYRKLLEKYTTNYNFNKLAECLNDYKDYLKSYNFSSQSKFESTVLEEFLFVLFSKSDFCLDLKKGSSVKAYSNLYFNPKSLKNFVKGPVDVGIHEKDQDFAIYREYEIAVNNEKGKNLNVPIISIECKTYLDKTMLEGSIATAEKVKRGNPQAKFYIVTETYDIDYKVDVYGTQIDQIYILRKQKRHKTRNSPELKHLLLPTINPKEIAEKLTYYGLETKIIQKEKDIYFEIDILPNRPDLLSWKGLIQEIGILLNCQKEGDVYQVQIPSSRSDITNPEDLLEELLRIYDYNKLIGSLPFGSPAAASNSKNEQAEKQKRILRPFYQEELLALSGVGKFFNQPLHKSVQTIDFYWLKGVLENIFELWQIGAEFSFVPTSFEYLYSPQSAEIFLGSKRIGFLGRIHPQISQKYQISEDVFVAQISLSQIFDYLSDFPPQIFYQP
ncbi:28579_t:CDS:2, partial [Racocetra persica]